MEAVQVTSDEGIDSITPMKRGCLFSYEHPENYTLKGHKKYTQVFILLRIFNINTVSTKINAYFTQMIIAFVVYPRQHVSLNAMYMQPSLQ